MRISGKVSEIQAHETPLDCCPRYNVTQLRRKFDPQRGGSTTALKLTIDWHRGIVFCHGSSPGLWLENRLNQPPRTLASYIEVDIAMASGAEQPLVMMGLSLPPASPCPWSKCRCQWNRWLESDRASLAYQNLDQNLDKLGDRCKLGSFWASKHGQTSG